MANIDDKNNMNPDKDDAKAKRRAAARKYAATHRESERARNRKYYAENRERLLTYGKAYRQTHKERLKELNHNRYLARREEILKKLKEIRMANPERCRENNRRWRANNRETELLRWRFRYRQNAEQISVRRKVQYKECPEPARARFRDYYARAMNARQTAVNVCPVFRFMLELKDRKDVAYRVYGANRYSFIQRRRDMCPALAAMDVNLCPMVANDANTEKQMVTACAMQEVFEIANAWDEIQKQACILRTQNSK